MTALQESLEALTAAERAELADLIRRTLDELPPADDPVDAGIRHSMRTTAASLGAN